MSVLGKPSCLSIVAMLVLVSVSSTAYGERAAALSAPAQTPEPPSLAPLVARSRIQLPGVLGRIDHFGHDGRRGNLFVAALGSNTVEVVNNLRVIYRFRGLGRPQGVLYVHDVDRLAVSGKDGRLRFYDGRTFKLLKTLDFGDDADNLRYEPQEKLVYVGYGDGAIAMVDPRTMRRLQREFALGSHPESFQFERNGRRIFVNLPDQQSIGVVDRNTGQVTHWKIPGTQTNHALAFDEAGRRLFAAALQPGRLWVVDSDSGRVVTMVRIVLGVDDLWFDPARKRILASGHAGFVSIIEQRDPDRYEVVANVPTGVGGGTSFYLKSRTAEGLYVALPNTSSTGSEILFLAVQE